MKKVALLIMASMFLYTCENNNQNVEGCTDMNACNFNNDANVDDGSCQFAAENFDCDGNCLNDTDSDGICDESENTSWVFVANEGNYGASNGTGRFKEIGPMKVLAYFGDARHDFPDPDDYYSFGQNMYMFPNPMYGKW